MTSRNISIEDFFRQIGQTHTPEHRFAGSTRADWKRWSETLYPQVIATLGRLPEKTDLNPEITREWEEDGLIKQRVLLDVEPGLAAPCILIRPAKAKGRLPAIITSHGHGPLGKNGPAGICGPEERGSIDNLNYSYGLQMAKAGFVTLSMDYRGFGERDDRRKPHQRQVIGGRDICNIHFLREVIRGRTLLGADVSDATRGIDYLQTLDFVDPDNIGAMGLSFGGTMTTWITLFDKRIKAADIICYSDRFGAFGMRDTNFCGSQITPGLFALCDLPDLHGLIAPRPLLIEIGLHDACFLAEDAQSCYAEVEKIYRAAGARDVLELDLFPGGHAWGANKSVEFFRKHLSGKTSGRKPRVK